MELWCNLLGVVLAGCFITDVVGENVNCTTYILRPDVPRIDKIWKCTGLPKPGPVMTVNQVCDLTTRLPGDLDLDKAELGVRPTLDDLVYNFQRLGQARGINPGVEVISSTPGLTVAECSSMCTDNPDCYAFEMASDGTCTLANTCTPAMSVKPTSVVYNVAYWYL